MRSDQDTIMERMTRWAEGLEQFDLPDWDSLPQLDLYMEIGRASCRERVYVLV